MEELAQAAPTELSSSQLLIAGWSRPARQASSPALVAVAGLPASGKSFFARRLAEASDAAWLASDNIRLALTDGQPVYDGTEHARVFNTLRQLSRRLLQEGYHVIVDATGIYARDRRASLEPASEAGARSAIVWCEVDEATAQARLAWRAAGADPHDSSSADAAIRARMAGHGSRPGAEEANLIVLVDPVGWQARLDELCQWLCE